MSVKSEIKIVNIDTSIRQSTSEYNPAEYGKNTEHSRAKRNMSFDMAHNMYKILESGINSVSIPLIKFNDFVKSKHGINLFTDMSHYVGGTRDMTIVVVFAFIEFMRTYDACFSYDKLIGCTSDFNSSGGDKPSWLWTPEDTSDIEKVADEVWVTTPDFYYDKTDEVYKEIVIRNITENSCAYRYIYPNNRANRFFVSGRLNFYADTLKGSSDNVIMFLPMPESDFPWMIEQTIFNPSSKGQKKERAILVNPMGAKGDSIKFDIELNVEDRRIFKDVFLHYWEEYQEKILTISKRK